MPELPNMIFNKEHLVVGSPSFYDKTRSGLSWNEQLVVELHKAVN